MKPTHISTDNYHSRTYQFLVIANSFRCCSNTNYALLCGAGVIVVDIFLQYKAADC